ncbi:universal stress protein [Solirubrobacter ginsenosidimutans]|uniref:Universal stress protein n=1 Tax=Solirubrobacter ginsenosidimutans TaxID=490573 RepID=A0A9X3S3U1_9ACTN|nr:universal stress protein [Solirubrobacter ginsenosidimutans]MDA0159928.1 universal stress protein [Solirubrobacter ginsenosidimutans]
MYGEIVVSDDGHAGGRDAFALAEVLRGPDTTVVFAHELVAHQTAAALHALAAARGTDLLIVGSRHHGPWRFGDHARAAMRDAPCQVAVTPHGYAERERTGIHSIGIGHTDTPAGRQVLDVARELAWELGAEVHAARVVWPSNWQTLESGSGWRAVAAARRMAEIPGVHGVAIEGDVERALARFALTVDLLVVGAHHHGAVRRFMRGDVAASLTAHAACPLLVV